jgi:4-alpha-glucanotransferase
MGFKRGSGILLHISSLHSQHGVGDLGPEAFGFIDFLAESGHAYWQVLPLNPTDASQGYSPYSCYSAFAGNPMLISTEELYRDGLLDEVDVAPFKKDNKGRADFSFVSKYKTFALEKAFRRFIDSVADKGEFELFCKANVLWLEDYALYMVLKNKYKTSWSFWPKDIRDRHLRTVRSLLKTYSVHLEKQKFIQYIFFRQFEKLHRYAASRQIQIIGDIPFYINHDSADCWTSPGYFKLVSKRLPRKIAGVPPDYFSETGQLWGFPTYNWAALSRNNFDWWVRRIAHNLNMFDILRLDHFRAFSAFWEVDAAEETAVKGSWMPGPDMAFFQELERKLGDLPLIAEDLGSLDEHVYALIAATGFPGMRVLQFAFDENVGINVHSPHLHVSPGVVYTGTHDNNTTIGWFNASGKGEKRRLSAYVGKKVSQKNVHQVMHRLALMSVADIAIIPMQDILGLDEGHLMNRPNSTGNHWRWRMTEEQFLSVFPPMLKKLNELYGRT